MENGFRVFIVDDDALMLDMVSGLLCEDCLPQTFNSAEACIAHLAHELPDMFLLDVSMPEMDGYDFCRYLKDNAATRDIPVTFISANDSADARLLGYEAGGEDFITKPFAPDELLLKVHVAQRITANKRALSAQAGVAQQTAANAISTASELAIIVQFFSRCFAAKTQPELARVLLDAMFDYDLQGAVQLRATGEVLSLSPNGQDLPLEVSVLNHVRTSGRIFQFKSRCVFNYDHVTLMVNNMPLEDNERCSRIRELCVMLAEGANARLQVFHAESLARRRQGAMLDTLPRVRNTLESLQDNYRRNCYQLTQYMIEYQQVLTKSFMTLGLTESQENFITDMARDYMQRMVSTQDQSLALVGQLEQLAHSLESVAQH